MNLISLITFKLSKALNLTNLASNFIVMITGSAFLPRAISAILTARTIAAIDLEELLRFFAVSMLSLERRGRKLRAGTRQKPYGKPSNCMNMSRELFLHLRNPFYLRIAVTLLQTLCDVCGGAFPRSFFRFAVADKIRMLFKSCMNFERGQDAE